MTLTDSEREYLATQRLGRLATVDDRGAPQNNPVGFFYNAEAGTIDIGGHAIAGTRKFRNAQRNPRVALVVDDLASVRPWTVRGVEVRGRAEVLPEHEPPAPGFGKGIIRIHPEQVFSWGIEEGVEGMRKRAIA